MRLEESFGTARQGPNQSMTNWLAYLENIAEELSAVGVVISDVRLANRLVSGLSPQFDSIKQALRARSDGPSLEAVRKHLLSYKLESSVSAKDTTPPLDPFVINRPYAHNNTHRGPMATAMIAEAPCPFHPNHPCYCPRYLPPSAVSPPVQSPLPPSTSSTSRPTQDSVSSHTTVPPIPSYCFSPYFSPYPSTLICHSCGKIGHTQNRYWLRFPHLCPVDPFRGARFPDRYFPGTSLDTPASASNATPIANPRGSALVTQAFDQPPPVRGQITDPYSFVGPESTATPRDYSHAFVSVHQALSPDNLHRNQYCLSSQNNAYVTGTEEPGK